MTAMRDTWHEADEWGRLYQLYAPTLKAVIASRVPPSDLDDVVQEAFATAFRDRARFDMARPMLPMLVVIAKRTAIQTWRRNNRCLPVADMSSTPDPDPSDVWEAGHRARVIASTFAAMNPRHRHLLYQRHIEGVRCNELAEAEGVPPNAMAAVLKRARQSFRSAYTAMSEGAGVIVVAAYRRWATRRRFAWAPGAELVAAGTFLAGAVALGVTATAPSPRLQVTATVSNLPAIDTLLATPAAGGGVAPAAAGRTRAASTGQARVIAPTSSGPTRIGAGPGNADLDIHSGGSSVTVGNTVETPANGVGVEGRTEVTVDCRGGTWGKACGALLLVPGSRRSD